MHFIGNLLWFILCGWWQGLYWLFSGILLCITIVGIPFGLQCFKFAGLTFFPFGKEINYGGNAVHLIANIIWLIYSGIPILTIAIVGCILCITIIGIPFGKQCFKIAKLAILPFGATITKA